MCSGRGDVSNGYDKALICGDVCNVHHLEEAIPVIRASSPQDKNPQTQEEEGEKARTSNALGRKPNGNDSVLGSRGSGWGKSAVFGIVIHYMLQGLPHTTG